MPIHCWDAVGCSKVAQGTVLIMFSCNSGLLEPRHSQGASNLHILCSCSASLMSAHSLQAPRQTAAASAPQRLQPDFLNSGRLLRLQPRRLLQQEPCLASCKRLRPRTPLVRVLTCVFGSYSDPCKPSVRLLARLRAPHAGILTAIAPACLHARSHRTRCKWAGRWGRGCS